MRAGSSSIKRGPRCTQQAIGPPCRRSSVATRSPASAKGAIMKVIRAEVLGMCFGVRDALKVIERIDDPQDVTIYGELVHNEAVLEQLEARGFQQADEKHRRALPMTPTVLITAHGISQRERERLTA